jgi:hypothetical protein
MTTAHNNAATAEEQQQNKENSKRYMYKGRHASGSVSAAGLMGPFWTVPVPSRGPWLF